jgi:cytochrome oxidase assembly protein ShyY1
MTAETQKGLSFRPNWKITMVSLLFFPLMISLGFWQLDRAEEKRQLQQEFERRQSAEPVHLSTVDAEGDLRYLKVRLQGKYDNDKTWLLDNRTYQGRPGYEIITPFKLADSDLTVMVNRGWIKGDISRRTLPVVKPVKESVALEGVVYVPYSEPYVLAPDVITEQWPRVIQQLDLTLFEKEVGAVFPFTVRIEAPNTGAHQANWMVVNVQPEKHTGYAVQWFAMAAALLGMYIYLSTSLGRGKKTM